MVYKTYFYKKIKMETTITTPPVEEGQGEVKTKEQIISEGKDALRQNMDEIARAINTMIHIHKWMGSQLID